MLLTDNITLSTVFNGEPGLDAPIYRNRGAWIQGEVYQYGGPGQKYIDMVSHYGSLFSAKRSEAGTTSPPNIPIDSTFWQVVIEKGYIDSNLNNWILDGGIVSVGRSGLRKATGTNDAFEGGAKLTDSYRNNSFIAFSFTDNSSLATIGLSTTSTPAYGFSFNKGNVSYIIDGVMEESIISYVPTDVFAVSYNSNSVIFYQNGEEKRVVTGVTGYALFTFSASIATITSYPLITGIRLSTFVPYIDWVQEWDSNKVIIGEKEILTPKLFAGVNNPKEDGSSSLTGVALGIGVNGIFDGTVGIAGYNDNEQTFLIGTNGTVKFGRDGSLFTIDEKGNAYIKNLNASEIKSGRLSGGLIDAKGITVLDGNNQETLVISGDGSVLLRGEIKSMDYIGDDKSGYALLADGRAILNNATVRGTVDLPRAGITNDGDLDTSVRIWAGANYAGRDKANFKVTQNGDMFALKGTFGGKVAAEEVHTGTIHMKEGEFSITNSTTVPSETNPIEVRTITPFVGETTYIQFSKTQSIINSDLIFGSESSIKMKYLNNEKEFNMYNTKFSNTGAGIKVSIDSSNDWKTGFSIQSQIPSQNASLSFGYSTSESWTNTMIVTHHGTKGVNRYGDICFRRLETRDDIDVSIEGSLQVRTSLSSNIQSIEMRSVTNEGWGFYVV